MATFVLVHGAWHGGWCWRKVTPLLRQAGHDVLTPTFTGMGERRHLLTRDVGLETHITDIVQILKYEDLKEIILVGHSYGGMVISGVAAQVAERIAYLVYLDAFLPADGECVFDLMPDAGTIYRNRADNEGQGWLIPPPTASDMGVTAPADAAWVEALFSPITLATFTQPVHLANMNALPTSYILCEDYFAGSAARAQVRGWDYHELRVGHDAMITAPLELARILLDCAASL